MNFIKIITTIVFINFLYIVNSQSKILNGHVSDQQGNPLFAVNVYLLNQNTIGTISDLDGNFMLKLNNSDINNNYLVFSFVGYKEQRFSTDSINFSDTINIVLKENTRTLNEVLIEGRISISKEFSIKEMDKLQIYLSPLSSADPLKAIGILPASTNTSETANPELRGSEANRTKVFLNGVPISNPVRNSQINGIGFFSLFNTELIKNMLVYPSNPPLIYGNTSAGSIDIETEENLESNHYQVSASLASSGICISQKLSGKCFLQLFGNLTYSDAYLLVNPDIHKYLKGFHSNDIALNFHSNISENFNLNIYSYLVSESSDVLLNLFTWLDHAIAKTTRNFNIMNLKFQKSKNYFSFNIGTNFSHSQFSFGNINSTGKQSQTYVSLNYKYLFSDKLNMQTGISNQYGNFHFQDEIPVFYYAMSPVSPSYNADTMLGNQMPEAYIYFRWRAFDKIILGFGSRKSLNLLHNNNPDYISLQANIKYNFSKNQSLQFSAGNYSNITEPSYSRKEFRLLSARQVALEYLLEKNKTNINLSAYFKNESGDTTGTRNIKGFEVYIEQDISQKFKLSISNALLNSEIGLQNSMSDNESSVGYFLTTILSYFNPDLFNVSVSWSTHQGKQYTPVSFAVYNPTVDFYQPIYAENQKSKRFGNYNTINFSFNKIYNIRKTGSLIVFFSVNNLLNTQNSKSMIYNKDYSTSNFDYYQRRSLYFGLVLGTK